MAVKVGRTDEGTAMAKAHTGHLTGSDAVVSAVFRQYGVQRVDGLDQLLDVSAALARTKPPTDAAIRRLKRGAGGRVCVYSISGGTGAHMADMVAAAGLELPPLTKQSQTELHTWIPPYLRVSNPVDNGGAPVRDWRGPKIIETMLADPNVDLLLCPITGALPSMGNKLCEDLVAAAATTDKPVFVVWGSPVGDEEAYRDDPPAERRPHLPHLHQRRDGGQGLLRPPPFRERLHVAVRPPGAAAQPGRGQGLAPASRPRASGRPAATALSSRTPRRCSRPTASRCPRSGWCTRPARRPRRPSASGSPSS